MTTSVWGIFFFFLFRRQKKKESNGPPPTLRFVPQGSFPSGAFYEPLSWARIMSRKLASGLGNRASSGRLGVGLGHAFFYYSIGIEKKKKLSLFQADVDVVRRRRRRKKRLSPPSPSVGVSKKKRVPLASIGFFFTKNTLAFAPSPISPTHHLCPQTTRKCRLYHNSTTGVDFDGPNFLLRRWLAILSFRSVVVGGGGKRRRRR